MWVFLLLQLNAWLGVLICHRGWFQVIVRCAGPDYAVNLSCSKLSLWSWYCLILKTFLWVIYYYPSFPKKMTDLSKVTQRLVSDRARSAWCQQSWVSPFCYTSLPTPWFCPSGGLWGLFSSLSELWECFVELGVAYVLLKRTKEPYTCCLTLWEK